MIELCFLNFTLDSMETCNRHTNACDDLDSINMNMSRYE